MNSIRLYEKYLLIHLKSMMQHKTSFFLTTLGQFLVSFNVFLGVYFMMDRFQEVKGFSYGEILLCFSITLMAFTIAETIFRSLDTFDSIIGNGEFDRILLRPRNSLFLVVCSKTDLTRIGRLLQAAVMFAYGLSSGSVNWTPARAGVTVLMVLGGVGIFAAVYLIFATMCFFTLEGLEFMNVFTDGAREYGKYPIGIYGKTLLTICTFLVPFALFQYYPFLYLTGKSSEAWYCLLPLAACLFLIPAVLLWNFGLSRYQSSGS
ncbi:ABC-2 family transporter protein [Lachnospiraceae bacterium 54-53]